jgi:hypothetical protein
VLYTVTDAARLLNLRHADVEVLLVAGRQDRGDPADRGWLASVEHDGRWLISDEEISGHLELVSVVIAEEVLADGDRDDALSLGEAARLLLVTPRYVRGLCSAYLRDEYGRSSRTATLRCHRADDRLEAPYRIRRCDVAEFAAHRPTALPCRRSRNSLAG